MRFPHKCPICNGSCEYAGKLCKACDGKGIIWSPDDGIQSIPQLPAYPIYPYPSHPYPGGPYPTWGWPIVYCEVAGTLRM